MQSTRLSYSRTSWKLDSQKSIGRTVHRGPCTPTESAASNTQAQKADHYILCVRIKLRSGAYATPRQDTDYAGAGGWSGVLGAARYQRYDLPDMDVCTSYFKARGMVLSPSGPRGPTPLLQRRLRRLWRDMVEASGSGAGPG
jgi:hypothetical protein